MSSIYKKGRDGYYYYQAYLHNPKSGKKDKKIFHSLRTKDKKEAEKKQVEYDDFYREDHPKHIPNIKKISLGSKIKILATITSIIFISLILIEIDSIQDKKEQDSRIIFKSEINNNKKGNINKKSNSVLLTDPANKIENKSDLLSQPNDNTKLDEIIKTEKETIKIETKVPKYEIVRIERLPDNFDQGKIFAIVENGYSDKGLNLLCNNIRGRYKEFSNIIICIYTDTKIGFSLANGNDQNINTDQHKKEWLVMYSYNSVEGEYYDNDPGRYLGAY